MATTTDETTGIDLGATAAPESAADPAAGDAAAGETGTSEELEQASLRLAVAMAFPVVACAVMVGGVFLGVAPRVDATLAGILGVALATGLARLRGRAVLTNALVLAGLFSIGLAFLVLDGLGNVTSVRALVAQAAAQGDVLRPPVDYLTGWRAVVGWTMGIIGFVTAWIALVVRRPAIALLIPLPTAAIAAISVPEDAQIISGIVVVVLFAVGLGLLSAEQSTGAEDERPPLAYELRKAAKALPLLAVVTVALVALAQTNFLFPPPLIDPTQEPQRPRTVPLSEVEDRVLFEVDSILSGPWRIGSLDVYDGEDWRLPAFAESELREVPRDGVVDRDLQPGVRATFTVAGLGGAVLPGLPNTVGIVAEGPRLSYDPRTGSIRLAQGSIEPGLTYTVAAAALPSLDDLRAVDGSVPAAMRRFLEIPEPGPEVRALLTEAFGATDNLWDTFDYLRTWVLENVVASGMGTPVSITPDRADEIIGETLQASPYEIVALQAMLARWAGVPARIGYGYDQGDLVEGRLQVRPRHGASFVEVWFPGFKWLPVIGTPQQAQPSMSSDDFQQVDPNIVPSDDIAIELHLPVLIPPGSDLARQILLVVLVIMVVSTLAVGAYTLYPALAKSRARARRRTAAAAAGPRARIALAYAEWRDHATDLGYSAPNDTPLMFLDRFVDDDEHTELAWLTTRCLWGDLRHRTTPEMATIAETLSRSLRRRLSATQSATLRAVGMVSRLSMRNPYAPATDLTRRGERRRRRTGAQTREERGDALVHG